MFNSPGFDHDEGTVIWSLTHEPTCVCTHMHTHWFYAGRFARINPWKYFLFFWCCWTELTPSTFKISQCFHLQ